jgi:hypothetical protein
MSSDRILEKFLKYQPRGKKFGKTSEVMKELCFIISINNSICLVLERMMIEKPQNGY